MITRIIIIIIKRSQMSASFISADLGRDSNIGDRSDANTRNPVMAPMNLLLKSVTSMNRVKYTRNHRTKVWRKVVMVTVTQILSSLMVNSNLLPSNVLSVFADSPVTLKVLKSLLPLIVIGLFPRVKHIVWLFFHGKLIIPTQLCVSNGY